jgi:CRP/FNR family cyclic AMP-dependent transcriptional regulator
MNTSMLKQLLAEHPFSKGLDDAQLETLAGYARFVSGPEETLLARERHDAHGLYLIKSGRVAIEVHSPRRGAVTVQTLGPGEVFGWSWLIAPHQWHFDAKALEPTTAILLEGPQLLRLCESDHHMGFQLLRRLATILAGRLAATRLQLLDEWR